MPKLILICGTSFAGKSTLARLLAARFGYPEVDVDHTKTEIYGDDIDDRSLTREDWQRIYRETDRRIAEHLTADRSVIDASRNFRKSERDAARAICGDYAADLVIVHVDTPEHVTRVRLAANRRTRERRDVSDADYAAILAAWEPPTTDERPRILHFGDDLNEWITANAAAFAT